MTSLQPQTPPAQSQGFHMEPQEESSGDISQDTSMHNSQTFDQNAAISLHEHTPLGVTFRSNTIAPSPSPPAIDHTHNMLSSLPTLNTSTGSQHHGLHPTPASAGLRLQTDLTTTPNKQDTMRRDSDSKSVGFSRSPELSFRQALGHSVGSSSNFGSAPNSAFSSPMLSALTDVTPLPSPLMSHDSPGPWKKLAAKRSSREYSMPGTANSVLVTSSGESVASAILNQTKRKAYNGLMTNASDSTLQDITKGPDGHERTRSVSEYVPEAIQTPKTRPQAVSGSHLVPESDLDGSGDTHMRREPHLAVKRGIAPSVGPLSPPSSRTGESSDSDSSLSSINALKHVQKRSNAVYFEAKTPSDQKRRRWRSLKLLGEGTFSKVMLATSQMPEDETIDENSSSSQVATSGASHAINDRRKLVAVKICEHGPKGGASEERVEMSLKRELEIMKSIHHPSLVNLKAWNIEETRAILILSYCPGGDLFDVATMHKDLLVPRLLQRITAELVGAIQYLHERHIVHRDIKLENVLVNLPPQELAKDIDWATYQYSVITLTDLGLSRRVADDEKLTTRCGSDDYAAPEVIMGQPYDGRAVDAWSLGVLLYALLESRLPFDPTPGMSDGHKQRSKTSHRIARVEWCWVAYTGEDGDHEGDEAKFEAAGLKGAMIIVEGLLKRARSRWTIAKVADQEWIKTGINVDGGIKFREEDTPDEIAGTAE